MRTAIYCRVSTSDQTTENQVYAIEKYCHLRDIQKVELYEDIVSGAQESREGLERLRNDIRKGRFKTLIVWKLDRLARSSMHLLELLSFFQKHGVSFVSVTENVDTVSAAGKMLVTFLGAIAEFERELIRERVHAGLERARHNKVKLGRPRRGFDLKKALRLRAEGMGYDEIAKLVGASKSTVYRGLKVVSKTPVN
ncbi:Resolvase-like protein [Lentisphaera araneosa HTCC2155]|uniref:Resolvase-like protein n=1 Tax=Lentisphaera araneosa HTCC2155 TaxID=313628 RepID=A6DQA5_9BACT|nr:recombinase family protein [Lentisphaera araneosa]EDM26156.1 Resolvase-like protein [Lentisphaera araneosa HTCC2155]